MGGASVLSSTAPHRQCDAGGETTNAYTNAQYPHQAALPAEPSSALGTLGSARLVVAILTLALDSAVARSRDAGAILVIGREEDLVGLEVTLLGLAESADA